MRLVLSFFRKIDKAGFERKRAGFAGMAYKRKGREMETRIVKIKDKAAVRDEELLEAAEVLRNGGLVAFPTETVYGLGGNALDERAAEKIYAAKGRPSDNPLIAHISCMEELSGLVREIPEAGKQLAAAYWPGPLTMIFPKKENVPYETTGGLDTVAVRMPSDPVASRLIRLAGVPVAAPSANTSGRPSPTRAEHVIEDLNGKIPLIVDGGQTEVGIESTVVKVQDGKVYILRPGKISKEDFEKKLNAEVIEKAGGAVVESPGVKYAHYMPKCRMVLAGENDFEKVRNFYNSAVSSGKSVVIFCKNSDLEKFKGLNCVGLGEDSANASHNLFKALRDYEENDLIIALKITNGTMAAGLYNRMSKAARGEEI